MISRLRQKWRVLLKLLSHQPQNTPSEIFGSAPKVNIREIEKQGRSSIVARRPIRECLRVQTFSACLQRAGGQTVASQTQDQVHAPAVDLFAHIFPARFQACRGRFPALGIELPHPLDMARKMSFGDECSNDGLRKPGTAC
jgi:hypothetical protein